MNKTLSIIIPVYNEALRLPVLFRALEKGLSFRGVDVQEVIFVNDGSTDGSLELLKLFQKTMKNTMRIQVISYSSNKGKGHTLKKGVRKAVSDYVLTLDADLSTSLSEFRTFLPYLTQNTVLFGTRKTKEARISIQQPIHRQLFGRAFTHIANVFLQTDLSDFTCGFKVYPRKAYKIIFKHLEIAGWGHDAEIAFIARQFQLPITEIPVRWKHVNQSKVHVFRSILSTLTELIRIRLYGFRRRQKQLKLTITREARLLLNG